MLPEKTLRAALHAPFDQFHSNCPALKGWAKLIISSVVHLHVKSAGRDLCAPLESLRQRLMVMVRFGGHGINPNLGMNRTGGHA